MITLTYMGELGNRLFQRALAEIFSRQLDLPVREGARGAPEGAPTFTDHHALSQTTYFQYLYNSQLKKLHLEGHFEKSWIYLPHRDLLRDFYFSQEIPSLGYPTPLPILDSNISPLGVAVCIRRAGPCGNPADPKAYVPLEYYTHVLDKHFKGAPVYVFTDATDHPDIRLLQDRYPVKETIYGGGIRKENNNPDQSAPHDLAYLSNFNNIIHGISTFYWWGIFLSTAERVYAPILEVGRGFGAGEHINLYLPFVQYSHYTAWSPRNRG